MSESQNSLARASSSYLRSAMHQPVEWHEWSADAFEKAQRENKPVLLDVGAVWCHWCHVMDRESYENPEIAKLINENYVAVKVDRDERPDVDSRYQAAVQAISGQGGWPLTMFLAPDGGPFFGGTYFPKEARHGLPAFPRLCERVAEIWKDRRSAIESQNGEVLKAFSRLLPQGAPQAAALSPAPVRELLDRLRASFDARF